MIYKFYHSLPHLFLQPLPLPSEMVAFLIWYVAVVLVFPFTTILLWGPCTLGSCCSVARSCPTLFDLMDCSTPGFPVPHRLLEFAQVHVHCIGDAIQPSHPLMPARILEWVAIPSSRGSSWLRDQTYVSYGSCIGRQALYHCATWEARTLGNHI